MIRRTWLAGLGLAALAALGAVAVYLVAAWALSVAAPNMWLDANVRARMADDISHTADRLSAQHESTQAIAQTIFSRIAGTNAYNAVVVDDSGKVLAGDSKLLADRPGGLPLPPPPPPEPQNRSHEFRGFLYASHPPISHGITYVRTPLSTLVSPTSIVRIDGAWVIFQPSHDALTNIQQLQGWIVFALVIVTFVLVWLLARRMLFDAVRPMDRLRQALLRLSQGDYARFETLSSRDDVAGELVEAYNAAASEMATASRQRNEIVTNMQHFVADAGHELRTPLAVIMGYVQLLRQGGHANDAMTAQVFSEIDDQGKRMSTLIQKLLLLTRLDSQEPQDVKIIDAADVAENVVGSFRPLSNGATLLVDVQKNAFVQVSESELHEAIGNLIDNALKYAPGSHIATRVRADGNFVTIAVADDGPGMSPDVRARAFERFSRGESGGSITGSGLGLAIVDRAVQRAGGSVSLQTSLGNGTTVELRLPAWHGQTN